MSRVVSLASGFIRRLVPALALATGIVLASAAIIAGAAEDSADGDYLVVRHLLYLTGDGSVAVEEQSSTRVSAAYVVNDHIWDVDSLPIRVSYNPADAPAGHDVPKLLQDAIATWNGAGSNFAFQWEGESNAFTGACNGQIRVDGINNVKFTPLAPLVLGQTCTIYPPGGAKTKLVEFDMQLNPDINWSSTLPTAPGKYDLGTTILHEFGHAAGLGHNCPAHECDDSHEPAVMFWKLTTATTKRSLTQDDLEGIRTAYGAVPTPPPTAVPTATPTPSPTVPPGSPVFERARAPQLARD
jgi:hypothetical protein